MAKILVVDDNREVAHAIADLLKGSGHDVALAANTGAGLAEEARFGPQAVLVDASLPDALTLVRSIRSRRGKTIRLIACTSFESGAIDRRHFIDAGFDGVLGAPLFFKDVQKVLSP